MKSFLKKVILFVSIALVLSYALYFLLNIFQLNYYKNNLKTRWAVELKNKHVDYLLLGSSRMANMIVAKDLDSSLSSTSINIATAGSSYGESYVLFQQYLAHGNTAKTLLLSFDLFRSRHLNFDAEASTPLIFKHFDFFPYEDVPEIKAVYKSYTAPWHMHLWKFLPFSRCAEFNSYFKVDSIAQFIANRHPPQAAFNRATGGQLIYKYNFKGEKISVPGAVQLGPRSEKYLLKILTLAKQHNISIILVTAPYYKMQPFDRRVHNQYVDFLKDRFNVRYIDFTSFDEWKNYTYFSDATHTNAPGSRLYTRMVCDSLQVK